nr:hypothetical protein [Tanacetum cinerariifolium]
MQTQTSNTLYNAIMEAGGKDHLPMLAPGNYVQWKSIIKRYIDTKLNHELIQYCLKNSPYKYTWADKIVPDSEGGSKITTVTYMENYKNVSQDIRDQLNAEAEAVQIILTGIDNDIYSIIDACPNACEMWKAIERMKPKRVKDATYHKEKMLSCKQEEAGIQLNAEQADWRDDTDDESEDQKLEAHYIEQIDQDDADDLDNERELLASLIEKLKCEIDDNKNRNKILETSNKVLVEKLKEFDRRNDVKYASKVEINCAKAKGDLISYKMESQKSFNKYTQTINDLNQTILELKKKLSAHQETISILSQAKEAQIKLYKTREDKEIDKSLL